MCVFHQREYTYEEMKKWEDELNEEEENNKIIVIEKGEEHRKTTLKK